MLLSMIFDEEEEGTVTAMFQVGDVVMQLKQRPDEGRLLIQEKEEQQEHAMEHPEQASQLAPVPGEYDSAFPNVGLVVWQAGFVLAEYLLRTKPLGPWKGLKVLELGCGTGQLGIALALAGADVTLTDLAHITPLTQVNVDLNAACCEVKPTVLPYMWGTPVEQIQKTALKQQHRKEGQQQQQQQLEDADGDQQQQKQQEHADGDQQQQKQQEQGPWDVIVAADVLYEPQYFGVLLSSLEQLCPAVAGHEEQHQQQQGQGVAAGEGSSIRGAPPIYICYRVRKYREGSFEAKAEAQGFKVTAAPSEELHEEYNCGGWRLISLTRQ